MKLTESQREIINNTVTYVKKELIHAEGGHDWWHINRVWLMAQRILKTEKANPFIVELGALLHDIADSKFHNGDEKIGPTKAQNFLKSIDVNDQVIKEVVLIIENISFKGGHRSSNYDSLELKVLQDADRLDAIGAVGIARTFNYGGFKNRAIYDPTIPPNLNMTKDAYKKSTAPTINHFYEKLLLLKDLMHTDTGQQIAQKRHDFMLTYLDQFYAEWKGEK